MTPVLYIGALTAIWTINNNRNIKPTKHIEFPLWFVCILSFLFGFTLGWFIITLTRL